MKRLIGLSAVVILTANGSCAQNKAFKNKAGNPAFREQTDLASAIREIDKIVPVSDPPVNTSSIFEIAHKPIGKDDVGRVVEWEGTAALDSSVLIKTNGVSKYCVTFAKCTPPVSLIQGNRVKVHGRLRETCTITLQIQKGTVSECTYSLYLDDGATATVIPQCNSRTSSTIRR